ncbi:MAG: hypothetical protein C4B58_06210 [Deltaproteobacteria bacterium]|nr:MAG: hypothetical protein C4B58_06210 [Deltaproteobacteria bacterium]
MISTPANRWRWWVGIAILVFFFVFLLLGLSRYWGHMSSINDLGQFDQAIWGGLHGVPFLNTINRSQQVNWLSLHFQPILFFFTPLYAISPSVIWLTIAQAFALSLAALPIFLLASRIFASEKAGLLWALAYLVNPFLLNAAAWDFHPITLAVPFVAISMLSIESKNFRLLFLCCLVILSCKEHLGVMVIGFGLLWWIKNKRWKSAICLIFLGVVHTVLVFKIIMPALSPTGEHLLQGRYSWLGNSQQEALNTLFTQPIYLVKKVMLEMGGASYLFVLLIFLLGFPLAAPEYLLPGLADLITNMLSEVSMPRSLFGYHSVCLVPLLTVAALYGVERISRWNKKFSAKELARFAVIAIFIEGYFFSPLPLPGAYNYWAPVHFPNLPDPIIHKIRSVVGEEASVSAQANIGAHFSQRREIYRYPNKMGEVDAIILRLESPTIKINNLSEDQIKKQLRYTLDTLDSHLQMDRAEYIVSIERLLSGKEYGILIWSDPWLILGRDVEDYEPHKQIEKKLNQLRKEWQINSSDYNGFWGKSPFSILN